MRLSALVKGLDPRSTRGLGRALSAMRPAPRRTVREWAEAERVVPRGTSPRAGRWRTEPFQAEVLEAVTDPRNTEGVLYIAASQLGGKTEVALNTMGYFIGSDPASQLFVTYSVEMAQRLSKRRVATMIRESPGLRERVRDARSRDSGNTILDKEYDGGELSLVGANSAGGLSMAPKRVLIGDELDRWPASAGTEGDPLLLAVRRTAAYWNAVKLYVTSPGVKDISRSWRLWKQSDQREWFVDCPDCGTAQHLKWAQVQWEKDAEGGHRPETAVYACERCGSAWSDIERWRACERGRYQATAPFTGLAGFRISALAVPSVPLEKLVREWLAAQGNPEELKVFKTTVLSEWWEDQFTALDDTGLLGRRETYVEREGRVEVPAPCALVTAGVDVQDNRFEVSVYAWGAGEESWCLGHEALFGDPSAPELWAALDEYLLRPWPRALGGVDFIRGACVDTGGHHTQAAYEFCGARYRRPTPDGGQAFVFAVKGQAGAGELWPRAPSKATRKVPLWPLRVDVGKEQLYGRLALAKPGPGYIHFPTTLGKDFFEGLTAEKLVKGVHRRSGRPTQQWKLKRPGMRNEPLDCAVLAYAAVCGLRANGFDLEAEVEGLPRRPVFVPESPGVGSGAASG